MTVVMTTTAHPLETAGSPEDVRRAFFARLEAFSNRPTVESFRAYQRASAALDGRAPAPQQAPDTSSLG
jgi:hypothetical protein